ncbi:hypothetical protein OAF24_03160, partial [bacterium]|nr:hypothetical protein [bacterium]
MKRKQILVCTFFATTCLVLLLGIPRVSSAQVDQKQQTPFLETLKELKLSDTQKQKVFQLLREYRGKYQTDQFRSKLLEVLTPEQAEKLAQLKSPPGSRIIPADI